MSCTMKAAATHSTGVRVAPVHVPARFQTALQCTNRQKSLSLSSRFTSKRRHSRGALSISAHGADADTKRRPGEKKGFVEEMRFVAMKLHTKDQAPKEGGKEAQPSPFKQYSPTLESYLQFLVESKVVYEMMEEIVASGASPSYAEFLNTGLERSAALTKDIEWFISEKGVSPRAAAEGGAGLEYAAYLRNLADTDVPSFICHFYNVYFAHSAGGKMIGKKVSDMILDGQVLEFYQWDGELKELLEATKARLNNVAEGWTREEKDRCLEETELSFKYSGQILRTLFSGIDETASA